QATHLCIKDHDALISFFPGTVSALTKCLTPSSQSKRSTKVLVEALNTLKMVLSNVIGDVKVRAALDGIKEKGKQPKENKDTANASWLKATASQVKLALANVVKLRNHDRIEVRKALSSLCISVLDECHASLSESAILMVETLI